MRSEYTGRRARSAAWAGWCLCLLLLGAPRAAQAQSAWSELPLPGGRAELLPRLGLRADLPRALVVGEIVRTVHQARDPKSQILATLNAYFATPPATGDEMVPVPLAPDVWRDQILLRAVPDHDLLGAILADRRAALLCYGLLGLDRETLAFVAGSPALVKRLYERDASPFAGYAHVLRVRNGALELPGGAEAAPIWDALAGAPTADAAAAILALLTRDNARLAYFAEALETLDPAHLALVFPPDATADARAAAARLAYRSFVTVDGLRDLADLPFQRVSYDPGALLAALPLQSSGAMAGTATYWQALIQGSDVPEDPADAWPDLGEGDGAVAAPLLEHLASEALPGRRDLLATVGFVARMQRRMHDTTPADCVLLAHAFRRYPALMLTLERIGVADLNVWKAMVQQARRLDAKSAPAPRPTCRSRCSRRPSRSWTARCWSAAWTPRRRLACSRSSPISMPCSDGGSPGTIVKARLSGVRSGSGSSAICCRRSRGSPRWPRATPRPRWWKGSRASPPMCRPSKRRTCAGRTTTIASIQPSPRWCASGPRGTVRAATRSTSRWP